MAIIKAGIPFLISKEFVDKRKKKGSSKTIKVTKAYMRGLYELETYWKEKRGKSGNN